MIHIVPLLARSRIALDRDGGHVVELLHASIGHQHHGKWIDAGSAWASRARLHFDNPSLAGNAEGLGLGDMGTKFSVLVAGKPNDCAKAGDLEWTWILLVLACIEPIKQSVVRASFAIRSLTMLKMAEVLMLLGVELQKDCGKIA